MSLTALSSEECDGPNPGAGDRAAKEGHLARAADVGEGHRAQETRLELAGSVSFHDNRSPSLVITPDKNLWHCLGACQAGGSVIDWVMRAEGVSFRCAVEMLRGDLPSFAALSPKKSGKPKLAAATRSTTVKLPPVLGESARRRGAPEAGGRLLPRDLEGEPRGALLSPRSRPAERGDGGTLPDRFCEPRSVCVCRTASRNMATMRVWKTASRQRPNRHRGLGTMS